MSTLPEFHGSDPARLHHPHHPRHLGQLDHLWSDGELEKRLERSGLAELSWDELAKAVHDLRHLMIHMPELSAVKCRMTPGEWHLTSLQRLLTGPCGNSTVPRVQYHAAWLRYLLKDSGPRQFPLVSFVVPAFNAGASLREAVGSALAQSYPRLEVVVVDDGSTDGAAMAMADVHPNIRVIRQENRGVAEARNRGIREARGEFLHFLDADDLVDRDCVMRKFSAFHHVPDAELCFSLYRCVGDNGVKNARTHQVPGVGDDHCPSQGLLNTVLRRFPFQISSVMAPRWVFLENGPFDSDLRQSQDNRYWFRLALRDTKVIGLEMELNTRRFQPGSLTSRAGESVYYSALSYLRNLNDLLAQPKFWRAVPIYARRVFHASRWKLLNQKHDMLVQDTWQATRQAIAELPILERGTHHAARPMCMALRLLIETMAVRHQNETERLFLRETLRHIRDTFQACRRLTPDDVREWLDGTASHATDPPRGVIRL